MLTSGIDLRGVLKMPLRRRRVSTQMFDAGQPMVRVGIVWLQLQDVSKTRERIVPLLNRKKDPAKFLVNQRIVGMLRHQRLQNLERES